MNSQATTGFGAEILIKSAWFEEATWPNGMMATSAASPFVP